VPDIADFTVPVLPLWPFMACPKVNFNARKRLYLYVQLYNIVVYKKCVVNIGIELYNKLPNYTKELDKYKFFYKGV
jgi:hypothetical protein